MGAIPATARRDRDAPTVWMVRAGEGGVHAPVFVQEGAVFLGWGAAGDISGLSLEAVTGRVEDAWPEYNRRQRSQAANALYKFAVDMQPGDVVVTPGAREPDRPPRRDLGRLPPPPLPGRGRLLARAAGHLARPHQPG